MRNSLGRDGLKKNEGEENAEYISEFTVHRYVLLSQFVSSRFFAKM